MLCSWFVLWGLSGYVLCSFESGKTQWYVFYHHVVHSSNTFLTLRLIQVTYKKMNNVWFYHETLYIPHIL